MPKYITNAEAVTALQNANRVLVVGCSGGGKSTLSLKLAAKYNMNLVSIDRDIRWLSGWVERDKQEQRAIMAKLVQHDRWIMDGSSPSSFDIRLPRTDLVLWVRVPRRMALAGIAYRVARNFGSVRPEMAEGCPEKIPDRDFLSYIWNFEKEHAPKFIHNIDAYAPNVPVAILKTRKEADSLVHSFTSDIVASE